MCDRHKVGHGLDLVCRLALDLRENLSKFENKLVSSPQILLQLVAALEAIGPLVAQSRKSEDLQKLLRFVQLTGEVSLKKNCDLFANDTNTIYFNCIIVLFFTHLGNHLMLF